MRRLLGVQLGGGTFLKLNSHITRAAYDFERERLSCLEEGGGEEGKAGWAVLEGAPRVRATRSVPVTERGGEKARARGGVV